MKRYLSLLVILCMGLLVGCSAQVAKSIHINENHTGKTVIKTISTNRTYPNNSYMIISKSGTVIVADAFEATKGINPDIITVTHNHPDHVDNDLIASGFKSFATPESFTIKDVKVTGIAASHRGDSINIRTPDDVIYVYEVDGLRIAHMGDIGQHKLTDEQMKALGRINIAFMQFVNPYSDYSVAGGEGFACIEQLKPQIIIPTHSNSDANSKIGSIVGAREELNDILTINEDDLKDGKRKVIVLNNTFPQVP